jgi:hypothetical protein
VVIAVHTSSFRTTRGYTLCAAVCDELAFWRTEDLSANPDVEILAPLHPGLMTLQGPLICITTPYSRRGATWQAFKDHHGKESDPVLVWTGSSLSMNPSLPEADVRAAYEADELAARAEYGGEFRSDPAAFSSEDLLDPGRLELPPVSGVRYRAFCDPSGGSQDSYALGIAHAEGDVAVLDKVVEVRPPFSPEAATIALADVCASYNVKRVVGDRYGGEFPRELFQKRGIQYDVSEDVKSDIYLKALPLMTSGKAELLDDARLIKQLRALERRTGPSGRTAWTTRSADATTWRTRRVELSSSPARAGAGGRPTPRQWTGPAARPGSSSGCGPTAGTGWVRPGGGSPTSGSGIPTSATASDDVMMIAACHCCKRCGSGRRRGLRTAALPPRTARVPRRVRLNTPRPAPVISCSAALHNTGKARSPVQQPRGNSAIVGRPG